MRTIAMRVAATRPRTACGQSTAQMKCEPTKITIEVPDQGYLIPLERALKDYISARQESDDDVVREWVAVMQDVLEQVKRQELA